MRASEIFKEDWQNWKIWDKLNGDSDDLDDSTTRFNKYYAPKIQSIAQDGGIGVQRTNGRVDDAIRLVYQHLEQQNPNMSPREIDARAKAQVRADVAKAQQG